MFGILLFAAAAGVVDIFYLFITTVPSACVCECVVASSFHSVNEIKLTVTLVFIFFYRCFYSISLLFWFYDRIPTDNHNNCVIQFSILSLSVCVHLSFCLSPFSHLLWENEHFFGHIFCAFHHFMFCLSLYAYLHFTYIFLCTLCFAFQSLYLTIFLYSMAKSCLCCSPPTLRCFAVLTWGISVAKAYKWKIMASDLPLNRNGHSYQNTMEKSTCDHLYFSHDDSQMMHVLTRVCMCVQVLLGQNKSDMQKVCIKLSSWSKSFLLEHLHFHL